MVRLKKEILSQTFRIYYKLYYSAYIHSRRKNPSNNQAGQMTTYIIRASHANEFELQNYTPLKETIDLKVVSSLSPLTPISLPTIRLRSPSDLPSFPFKKQLLNRLIGGDQWLLGLDELASIADQPIFHTAETY